MKHVILSTSLAMLLLAPATMQAQLNNKAAIIKVKPGMYMNVKGNFTNSGTIENAGNISVSGNYTNNGTFNSATSSSVTLKGGTQQIGGNNPTTFNNLVIDGTADKQIGVNTSISNSLVFNSNKILLGNYDLRLLPGASISGADNSKYIVTNGSGFLKVKALPVSTDYLFPVGDAVTSFAPVLLNYSGTVDTFRVRVATGVNPTTGSDNNCVQKTYLVEEMVAGGSNASLKLGWNTADEGSLFSRTDAFVWQNLSSTWTPVCGTPGAVANAPYTNWRCQASGLTNLAAGSGSFVVDAQRRALNLTVFLEGYYAGSRLMRAARDYNTGVYSDKWGATVTDTISVELHDPGNYNNIICRSHGINLNTNGTATATVPFYCGNYYLTVKHRNHLETVSAAALSMSGTSVNYDFSGSASQAYGNNLKSLGSGVFGVYAGDVTVNTAEYPGTPTQDGMIDMDDNYYVFTSYINGDLGYHPSDINGDGTIDINDVYLAYDNFLLGVYAQTP